MAKAIFDDGNHEEEAPAVEEAETVKETVLHVAPCRLEVAHSGHSWDATDGEKFFCEGRRRG